MVLFVLSLRPIYKTLRPYVLDVLRHLQVKKHQDYPFDVENLKQPNMMVSWYLMVSLIQTSKQMASSTKLW